ncbi:MAG: hypothetical protein VST71_07260 [Nitrospirota bacterium]|nr:hypothetical protein [Nitrospirota bacterium]
MTDSSLNYNPGPQFQAAIQSASHVSITVNAVRAGVIETELTVSPSEEIKQEFLGMIPRGSALLRGLLKLWLFLPLQCRIYYRVIYPGGWGYDIAGRGINRMGEVSCY